MSESSSATVDGSQESIAHQIRRRVSVGDTDGAATIVRRLADTLTGRRVQRVVIGNDEYSLNSVNGRITFDDAEEVFFKFHVEEDEEDNVGEYYRASVLADHDLPVDVPVATSNRPGEQIVLYEIRDVPRMSDVCLEIERHDPGSARLPDPVLQARNHLDQRIGEVLTETVHVSANHDRPPAAVHQLFTNRMVDHDKRFPGGRLATWYMSQDGWEEIANARWKLNGVTYSSPLDSLIRRAYADLTPAKFVDAALVVAHGDDHQGNVWVVDGDPIELRLFDPAFASDDLPALLAMVKSTFHNVFAHPFWLYHPHLVDQESVKTQRRPGWIDVEAPYARLSPMRQQILDSIVDRSWIPLLRAMQRHELLPEDWRQTIRSALFLCPFLVTNLCSPDRPPPVRMLGLAHAVMMGSEPTGGTDPVATMLDRMTAALKDE